MKISKTEVNWMMRWGNDPYIILHVDSEVPFEQFRFKERQLDGGTFYWAHDAVSGQVWYLLHHPGNETGFGGSEWDLVMEDGSRRTVKGPWSSRAGVANRWFEPHCVDVTLATQEGFRLGRAIRVDLVQQALHALHPKLDLIRTVDPEYDEVRYRLSKTQRALLGEE